MALQSRVAESVRVPVGEPFYAPDVSSLDACLRRLPWDNFLRLSENEEPLIKVISQSSRLYHTRLVESRVAAILEEAASAKRGAVASSCREHPLQDGAEEETSLQRRSAPTLLRVRLRHDECEVSVCATGPLHKRGYLKSTDGASVRETMAAACVLASPLLRKLTAAAHSGEELTLWDPFCGSGALLLETLGVVLGDPPGDPLRRYPFTMFPCFRAEAGLDADPRETEASGYEAFSQQLAPDPHPALPRLTLLGTDPSLEHVERARRNLHRFGRRTTQAVRARWSREEAPREDVELPCNVRFENAGPARAASRLLEDRPTVVLTSLPYTGGRRGEETVEAHGQLGRLLWKRRGSWRGVFCLASTPLDEFEQNTGLAWTNELRFLHSNRWVDLLQWTGQKVQAAGRSAGQNGRARARGFDDRVRMPPGRGGGERR